MAVDKTVASEGASKKSSSGRVTKSRIDYMSQDKDQGFLPRQYQTALFQEVMARTGTIVCLGTGTGKTFIAIMVLKELAHQIRPPFEEGGKRSVLLVPKVVLVEQQANVIRQHTDLSVGQYIGAMGVESWTKEDWQKQFIEHQVLVMTPAIFLMHMHLPLASVNLLIFDEAHHTTGDHPYNEIMKLFDLCKDPPKILGLTASLINSKAKPKDIELNIRTLEKNLKSKVISAGDIQSINKYGAQPTEKEVYYSSEVPFDPQTKHDMSDNILQFASFVKNCDLTELDLRCVVKVKRGLKIVLGTCLDMGSWPTQECASMISRELAELVAMKKDSNPPLAGIISCAKTIMDLITTSIRLHLADLSHPHLNCAKKMLKLLEVLKPYRPDDAAGKSKSLCGIVFAEKRHDVQLLSHWLRQVIKEDPQSFGFIKHNHIVGQSNSGNSGYNQASKHQEDILTRFRKHEYNLLIATSVLEEGLDVPRCNLVVRYDFPKTVREYIQSKGRARAENGSLVILCPEEMDERRERVESDLNDFRRIEKLVNSSVRDTQDLDDDDDDIADLKNSDYEIPPYIPKGCDGSPRVSMNNAIHLVNRYCMKLPSDSFTKLVPRSKIHTVEGGFECELSLPINCPIRTPIKGKVMPRKKLAKKAAAFEACVRLHQEKELDDNLLPVGKEALKNLADFELEPFEEDYDAKGKDQARPGTTKRRQYYQKKVAEILIGPTPEPNEQCFLYVFGMKLTCAIPDEQNTRGRKIDDPADSTRFFGLVTTKELPKLCDFPVFTRSGEVIISIEETEQKVAFTRSQLDHIASFHHYTFHDVLNVDKYPMIFDPKSSQSNYFLVPVNWNSQINSPASIDWNFMERVAQYKLKQDYVPSEEERRNFQFKKEDYEDAVIKPWYRQNKIQFYYYVAEICSEFNPRSQFPDKDYPTFEEYYKEKYGIRVMCPDQPLLDVDHTSARLNLLTPRFVNRKGMTLPMSTAKTKKEKRENAQLKQILIPELCVVHPFPASFWRKTVTLPCILYRLNSLLVSEQLRQEIAAATGIGSLNMTSKWPALNFGWTLTEVLAQDKLMNDMLEEPVEEVPEKEVKSKKQKMSKSEPEVPNDDDDLVIDTFDPEKYRVEDSNDETLADEAFIFNDANFEKVFTINTVIGQPVGDWDQPIQRPNRSGPKIREIHDDKELDYDDFSDDDMEDDQPRVGSPSNFESDNGRPWDQEEEDTQFFSTGTKLGLAEICAPTEINIQSLCEDITKAKVMDDESVGSDDDDLSDDDADEEVAESRLIAPQVKRPAVKLGVNQLLADGILTESPQPQAAVDDDSDFCFKFLPISDYNDAENSSDDISGILDRAFPDEITHETVNQPVHHPADDSRGGTNFGELLPKDRRNMIVEEEELPQMKFDAYKDDPSLNRGPSPSMILQALTMSNASDGINLERLETVGDSFLKYAVTAFLYVAVPNVHEGKLSYIRSRIISNYNLYGAGKRKGLGEYVVASKFEPNDNWLPPGYVIPSGLEKALIELGTPTVSYDLRDLKHLDISSLSPEELRQEVLKRKDACMNSSSVVLNTFSEVDAAANHIPYNLLSQQSIPDKSIADCVEALIGAYLLEAGPKGALLFLKYLGLPVMPKEEDPELNNDTLDPIWHHLPKVKSPLISLYPGDDLEQRIKAQQLQLKRLYEGSGLNNFERKVLKYTFKDKAYLVQAFTHNSYFENQVTDCYQRLEFLGDALLDYLVTRLLYEDERKHSPGTLTDLRSALVNNTFFASLAVEYEFHKYLKSLSNDLFKVISRFVNTFKWNTKAYRQTCSLSLGEGETERMDDVEVPKALGDIFESVAGAIYLDSGKSLDAVWRVYYRMMKPEIEHFSDNVPKSPIRELLEMEPQNATFGRPELISGKRVRVCVEVFGEGKFEGIGRNKRIAKSAAAKRALRVLRPKRKTAN